MRDIITGDHFYEDSDFGSSMQSVLDHFFRFDAFQKEIEKHNLVDAKGQIGGELYIARPPVGQLSRGSQEAWQRVPLRVSGRTIGIGDYLDDPDLGEHLPGYLQERVTGAIEGDNVRASDRATEQSPEEQALRRRRREAMVLGENGRPVQRGDIIQREPAVLDGNVEEELEQLREVVTEAEAVNDRSWWSWITRLRPDGLAPERP